MANMYLSKLKLNGSFWGRGPAQSRGYPHKSPNSGVGGKGWDNTYDNFNTIDDTVNAMNPPIPLGEMRTAYTDNTNCPGWYTMIYLALHAFSGEDISGDFSTGHPFCSIADGSKTQWGDGSMAGPFTVGACYTSIAVEVTEGMPLVLSCATHNPDASLHSSITDPYTTGLGCSYGWFWCEGVCPCKDVTLMQGLAGSLKGADITVEANMRVGNVMGCFTTGTGNFLLISTDLSNVADATGTVGAVPSAIGWACASGE